MTSTSDLELARPTRRRLRVALREPILLLNHAIGLALAAFGVDLVGEAVVDGAADVLIWALDTAMASAPFSTCPPVLALVEAIEPEEVRRLYVLGARAVLDRGTDPDVIAATAIAVGHGLVVAQPGLVDGLPEASEPLLLDRQELRWMRALAVGRHMSAIARTEGHSERDMYRKFKGVYAKLGVSGREEALVLLARADLLSERRA